MAHYRSPTGPGVPSDTGGSSTSKKRRSNPEWLGPVIAAIITGVLGLFAGAFGGRAVGVPGPAVTATTTVTATVTATSSPNGTGSPSSSPAKPGTVLLQKQGVQLTAGYELSFIDPTLRPMSITSGCPGGDLSVCGGESSARHSSPSTLGRSDSLNVRQTPRTCPGSPIPTGSR